MPNNPALRRAGATTVPAANKIQRGAAVAATAAKAVATGLAQTDAPVAAPGTVTSVNGAFGAVVLTAAGLGALQVASNLSDVADQETARTNLGFRYVDLTTGSNPLVPGGVVDNFSAMFYAAKKLEAQGGLHSILVAETGTGYTAGNYSLTIAGSGTGSGAAGKVVVAANGRIIAALVTTTGSNYRVSSRQVASIVSGSKVITLNNVDSTDITVGDSVVHPSFPSGTLVASKTTTTVTTNTNATASSAFTWCIFGLPLLSFSGAGAGSGELLKPVVGQRTYAVIQPGVYLGGWTIDGLHNTEFLCTGATLLSSSKNSDNLTFGPECNGVKVHGLTVRNTDATIYDPATRGSGIGYTLTGFDIELINCRSKNIPNWSIRLGVATDGSGPYYGPFKVANFTAEDCNGDGIHFLNRCQKATCTNLKFINVGDDAVAIYPDDLGGSATRPPQDISICGVTVVGGGWRGIFIGGTSRRIAISGVTCYSLSGFGMDLNYVTGAAGPTDVSISGFSLNNIGGATDGFRVAVANRFPINIDKATRVTIRGVTMGNITHTTLVNVTNSTDVSCEVWPSAGKTAYATSGNTNCSLLSE